MDRYGFHDGGDPNSEQRQTRCVAQSRIVLTHRYATSRARPSRDDERRSVVYNPPGSVPYQVARSQPLHNTVAAHYTPHPSQRHPYPAQDLYDPALQPQPSAHAPTTWIPPPASIASMESGNTQHSNIGGSYNNNTTRTAQRVNTQVAAQMNNTQTTFIQNLNVSIRPWFHKYACQS